MEYEEAVKRWAVRKLNEIGLKFDPSGDIKVDFKLDPGYACCGGSNPDCYCSFAESAKLCGEIWFITPKGKRQLYPLSYLDFANTLREILEGE